MRKYKYTFYPTYEEWKHSIVTNLNFDRFPFYPTYEEWKH